MPERRIIRIVDGRPQVVADPWQVLEAGADWDGSPNTILPLATLSARTDLPAHAGTFALWLGPTDEPALARAWFDAVPLIAVQFPKFTDGRGYSTAALLRTRFGWRGELRAIGDVLHDQLFQLRRVGFDSFALRPDRDPVDALRAFTVFSDTYQGSVDQPLPHFRRGAAPAPIIKTTN
ncbi:MAG TPA: DUF934 domain-containing protein [Burkholderiaceae bacterium]